MMKLKPKLSRYMIAAMAVWAICLVLFAAGYSLFYLPQNTKLLQLKSQYNQQQNQLEKAKLAAREEAREKIQTQFEEKRSMIGRFSTEQDAQTELVFKIGQIASELSLTEFSSKQEQQSAHPTVTDGLEEAWLAVEFTATFDQFAQFIHKLESNRPVVFVEKVEFSRKTETGKGHDVTLLLSFLTEKEKKNNTVAFAAE